MNRKEPRAVSKFAHDDKWLTDRCADYVLNAVAPEEFTNEIYDIIDANLAQFRIAALHGTAECEELRQDCAYKIFSYTLQKLVGSIANASKLNSHAYIFQAAYFQVLQFVNKKRRQWRMKVDVEVLNEILGQMVHADGSRTVSREVSHEEVFYEKVGNV